jgi:hypothetical protein
MKTYLKTIHWFCLVILLELFHVSISIASSELFPSVNIAKLTQSNAFSNIGYLAAFGVKIVDNYAYLISCEKLPVGYHLLVYKLDEILNSDTNIGYIKEISHLRLKKTAGTKLDRKGNYLYVGGVKTAIFNISNREKPRLVKTIKYSSRDSIKVIGDFLLASHNKIHLFDISNPANPILLKSFKRNSFFNGPQHGFYDTTISGNYLYAADCGRNKGIRIYEINTTSFFPEKNFISLSDDWPFHIDVMNGYLFCVTVNDNNITNLYSYSLTEPEKPKLLDSLTLKPHGRAFGITSDYCVIAGNEPGKFIDITDPSSMRVIGEIHDHGGTASGIPYDIDFHNNLALIGGSDNVLAVKFFWNNTEEIE